MSAVPNTEQNNMEANLVKLLKGEILARKLSKQNQNKESNIFNLVDNYDNDIESFLNGMCNNLAE